MVFFQNKCTRYWPDVDTTKDVGPYHVKHMKETEFTDYTLREFEITSETNVSATTKIWKMLNLLYFGEQHDRLNCSQRQFLQFL